MKKNILKVILFAVLMLLVTASVFGCNNNRTVCSCLVVFNAARVSTSSQDGTFVMTYESYNCWVNQTLSTQGSGCSSAVHTEMPPPITIIIEGNTISVERRHHRVLPLWQFLQNTPRHKNAQSFFLLSYGS
ncbi:MAG: hypothetical protein FWE22_01115 [Firmicutes bacterium]|nr:hypothetical protein [Bacillota bacterium]